MLFDWFTIAAQALNFLILVWLMKHFLYKPILNAIDARERLIAKELADAAAKRTEAVKEREEFNKKNHEFDQQRAELLTKATGDAKAQRDRLIADAGHAADELRAKRTESLKIESHNLNQALSHQTQKEVFSIVRKALGDLGTANLERSLGDIFIRRLQEMNGEARELLGSALKAARNPATLRSAFDLPTEQRATIQNAINVAFSADVHLNFETAPDLVSGIELSTNGQKLGWNIDAYLTSMEKSVGEMISASTAGIP